MTTTCPNCQTTWSGTRAEHCTVCHRTWAGTDIGDAHRVGPHSPPGARQCLHPDQMRTKAGGLHYGTRYDERRRVWTWDTPNSRYGTQSRYGPQPAPTHTAERSTAQPQTPERRSA